MAEPHAAHSHSELTASSMEIGEQRSTYRAFDGLVRYGSLGVAALVLFLTVMFCTRAGFFGAAIPTVILLIAGAVFLRSKPASIDTL